MHAALIVVAMLSSCSARDTPSPVGCASLERCGFCDQARMPKPRVDRARRAIWATVVARLPVVATCWLWQSSRVLVTYACGSAQRAHANAIDADKAKPFYRESAFVRFRPYDSRGLWGGNNPLHRALDGKFVLADVVLGFRCGHC
jgi:hypothetical protein